MAPTKNNKFNLKPLILTVLIIATALLTIFSTLNTPYIKGSACFVDNEKIFPIINVRFTHHTNCDSPEFVAIIENFPNQFYESTIRISRPAYMAIGAVIHHLGYSGFASAILLNLILAAGTLVLFYLLSERIFGTKIAIISAILLLFSSHFAVFLGQPHTEIAGNFVIVGILYLLLLYTDNPSTKKLLLYSIICGVLLMFKFIFALPLFILFMAIKHKKIKEFIVFIVLLILPTLLWYLYVTQYLGIQYSTGEVSIYKQGIWLFEYIVSFNYWDDILRAFTYTIGLSLVDVLLSFYVIPAIFALYGLLKLKNKNIKFLSILYVISFLIMFFAMLWGGPRLAFNLFPIIIPFSVYGYITFSKNYKLSKHSTIVSGVILILLLIAVSRFNVYDIVPQYDNNRIRCVAGVLEQYLCK
jgi:4-amino-4-deoxy-L-arabinose transferase-like glycosyltransferase